MDKVVAFLSLFPSNKNGGLSDKQYDERIRQFIGELNAVPEKELLKTMDDRTVLEVLFS